MPEAGLFMQEMVCIATFPEGDTEAKSGMVFACSQGMGPVTGRFQAQLCYVDFSAAKLETCQLWDPYLMGRGVNPTF